VGGDVVGFQGSESKAVVLKEDWPSSVNELKSVASPGDNNGKRGKRGGNQRTELSPLARVAKKRGAAYEGGTPRQAPERIIPRALPVRRERARKNEASKASGLRPSSRMPSEDLTFYRRITMDAVSHPSPRPRGREELPKKKLGHLARSLRRIRSKYVPGDPGREVGNEP